jgi:hypothetical protein
MKYKMVLILGILPGIWGEIFVREFNLALRHARQWWPSVDTDYKRVCYEAHNELSRVWHDQLLYLPAIMCLVTA